MSIIYTSDPEGRPPKYGQWAANLYSGCEHACQYCYVPKAARRNRDEFHSEVSVREGILPQFEKECRQFSLRNPGERVLFSFSCDPYNSLDVELGITRAGIEVLHANDLYVCLLTKGGLRAIRDFDLLGNGDAFGCTLTFVDQCESREWEPLASLPEERFMALQEAHWRGISTWAFLEPVINPEETLEIIHRTHKYVDYYRIGKLNHHPLSKVIDWHNFGNAALQLMTIYNKPFDIKYQLQEFI